MLVACSLFDDFMNPWFQIRAHFGKVCDSKGEMQKQQKSINSCGFLFHAATFNLFDSNLQRQRDACNMRCNVAICSSPLRPPIQISDKLFFPTAFIHSITIVATVTVTAPLGVTVTVTVRVSQSHGHWIKVSIWPTSSLAVTLPASLSSWPSLWSANSKLNVFKDNSRNCFNSFCFFFFLSQWVESNSCWMNIYTQMFYSFVCLSIYMIYMYMCN